MCHYPLGRIRLQLALEHGGLIGLNRLHREQTVHEQTVAARRRNSAGRSMRTGHKAHVLEIGHHIANRGR